MKAYLDYILDYYFDEDNRRFDWTYDLFALLVGTVMIFYKTQFPLEISFLISVPLAFVFRLMLLTLKFLLNKRP